MAFVLADRVKETTTTTGTGTITLAGAASGFQSFSAIGNGNNTYYAIVGQTTTEWEVGIGTYTSAGTTLSRTTVLASSNAGSLVNFSAGTKDVWCDYPAGRAVAVQPDGITVSVNTLLFSDSTTQTTAAASPTAAIGFVIDGGGAAITTGTLKNPLRIPFACTINSVTLLADQTGSIVIDIWKDTYANYPPTVADSICASAKPTLSSAIKSEDTTLTGWTKTVAAGDTLLFNVDSASTVQNVTLTLKVTKA